MAEGLRRILNEITSMKTMPDGDLSFLVQLETEILSYLRTPTEQAQMGQGANGQSPDLSMMGGGGGMGGGLPPGMDASGGMGSPVGSFPMPPPGTPASGGIPVPGAGINPDELRRVLANQGQ